MNTWKRKIENKDLDYNDIEIKTEQHNYFEYKLNQVMLSIQSINVIP